MSFQPPCLSFQLSNVDDRTALPHRSTVRLHALKADRCSDAAVMGTGDSYRAWGQVTAVGGSCPVGALGIIRPARDLRVLYLFCLHGVARVIYMGHVRPAERT